MVAVIGSAVQLFDFSTRKASKTRLLSAKLKHYWCILGIFSQMTKDDQLYV